MKTWKILAISLILSPAAFADEEGLADCLLANGPGRVEIYRLDRNISARVYENADADPIEFMKVKRVSGKKKPVIFSAKDFNLQINTQEKGKREEPDSEPQYSGHLRAVTEQGKKLELDLLCEVY